MTIFTWPVPCKRRISQRDDCCTRAQPLASHWWCLLEYQNLDALSELIFLDPGAKINGQYYRDVLQQKLLPAIRRVSGNMFIFQQDSAPAHRARDTIELLRRSTPDFIAPHMWPPNSPDLNSVDYAIWPIMQQRPCQTRVHDIDQLWHCLITVWCGLEQRAVDDAID